MSASVQTINLSSNPRRQIVGNILIFLAGLVLLASGSAKLANIPPIVTELSNFGYAGGSLTLVGILEVFSAALFLIPQTRSIGLLLVSSFLGGAIATHLQHGQSVIAPAIFLSLLWLGTWLRHPEVLWSLKLLRKGQSD